MAVVRETGLSVCKGDAGRCVRAPAGSCPVSRGRCSRFYDVKERGCRASSEVSGEKWKGAWWTTWTEWTVWTPSRDEGGLSQARILNECGRRHGKMKAPGSWSGGWFAGIGAGVGRIYANQVVEIAAADHEGGGVAAGSDRSCKRRASGRCRDRGHGRRLPLP